jgi:hypothetical protein
VSGPLPDAQGAATGDAEEVVSLVRWSVVEVNKGDTGLRKLRDEVGLRVRESAEAEGRVVSGSLVIRAIGGEDKTETPWRVRCVVGRNVRRLGHKRRRCRKRDQGGLGTSGETRPLFSPLPDVVLLIDVAPKVAHPREDT